MPRKITQHKYLQGSTIRMCPLSYKDLRKRKYKGNSIYITNNGSKMSQTHPNKVRSQTRSNTNQNPHSPIGSKGEGLTYIKKNLIVNYALMMSIYI